MVEFYIIYKSIHNLCSSYQAKYLIFTDFYEISVMINIILQKKVLKLRNGEDFALE